MSWHHCHFLVVKEKTYWRNGTYWRDIIAALVVFQCLAISTLDSIWFSSKLCSQRAASIVVNYISTSIPKYYNNSTFSSPICFACSQKFITVKKRKPHKALREAKSVLKVIQQNSPKYHFSNMFPQKMAMTMALQKSIFTIDIRCFYLNLTL